MGTSRRVFLKLAAALSATAAFTPSGVEAGILRAPGPGSVTGLLRHPDSALRIGEAYLRRHGESAMNQIDLDAISDRASPTAIHGSPRERLEIIRARIRSDYAEGRTVDVDGWILAKTEVALCVAAALHLRT